MTKLPLDFETKSSYTVVVGVTDGRGAGDTMVVTINLTDMQEVPIDNPQTQAVGKVNPDAEVTIETPDGVVAVTFPAGSRESSYQVRVDSASSNCVVIFPKALSGLPSAWNTLTTGVGRSMTWYWTSRPQSYLG